MDTYIILLVIAYALVSGFLTFYVATEKNRSEAWFWGGFFLGVLGLLAVVGVPKKSTKDKSIDSILLKKCDRCFEPIRAEALMCRHCGNAFAELDVKKELIEKLKQDDMEEVSMALDSLLASDCTDVVSTLKVTLVETFLKSEGTKGNRVSPIVLQKVRKLLEIYFADSISKILLEQLERREDLTIRSKAWIIDILGDNKDDSVIPVLISHLGYYGLVSYHASIALEKYGEKASHELENCISDLKKNKQQYAQAKSVMKNIRKMSTDT
jgi:hypothetical protein